MFKALGLLLKRSFNFITWENRSAAVGCILTTYEDLSTEQNLAPWCTSCQRCSSVSEDHHHVEDQGYIKTAFMKSSYTSHFLKFEAGIHNASYCYAPKTPILMTYLWPISWAIVNAVLRPMSLFILQLLAGLQMLAMSAIPGSSNTTQLHNTHAGCTSMSSQNITIIYYAQSIALYFKHCMCCAFTIILNLWKLW